MQIFKRKSESFYFSLPSIPSAPIPVSYGYYLIAIANSFFQIFLMQVQNGRMEGWMDGWVDGWMAI